MSAPAAERRFLTVSEAAEIMDAPVRSVRRWCSKGDIPAVRTAGGHMRIPVESLRERADLAGYAVSRRDDMAGW